MTHTSILDQPTDRKVTAKAIAALDLPRLIDGKPELPPKLLMHSFAWDLIEASIRHQGDTYEEDARSLISRVFKLARRGRPWG